MFFCRHKFEKPENSYQYCKICGKAIAIPPKNCNHNWEEVNSFETIGTGRLNKGDRTGTVRELKCRNCGEMKAFNALSYKHQYS